MSTKSPPAEYAALKAAHIKALREYNSPPEGPSVAADVAEEAAWDALIDYVETHNLVYTEFDPRGTDEV